MPGEGTTKDGAPLANPRSPITTKRCDAIAKNVKFQDPLFPSLECAAAWPSPLNIALHLAIVKDEELSHLPFISRRGHPPLSIPSNSISIPALLYMTPLPKTGPEAILVSGN